LPHTSAREKEVVRSQGYKTPVKSDYADYLKMGKCSRKRCSSRISNNGGSGAFKLGDSYDLLDIKENKKDHVRQIILIRLVRGDRIAEIKRTKTSEQKKKEEPNKAQSVQISHPMD